MQVDPSTPTLKAPGIERLKLNYDKVLTSFAFKFNLRRYTAVEEINLHSHFREPGVETYMREALAAAVLDEVGPARYCLPRHRQHSDPREGQGEGLVPHYARESVSLSYI